MEIILIIAIVAVGVAAFLGYYFGSQGKRVLEEKIVTLTSERDVQKANAENAVKQQEVQKSFYEQQMAEQKASFEQRLNQVKEAHEGQVAALKEAHQGQIAALKQMTCRELQA